MKKILSALLIVLVFGTATLQAQQRYIKVYSGGEEVYSASTADSNRLKFNHGDATFTHNGDNWTTAIAAIDSLVFVSDASDGSDTVAVDTVGAVRIMWTGDTAMVVNPLASSGVSVTVTGANVNVTSTSSSAYIHYVLSGSCSAGSFVLTTNKKVVVCLDDLTLTAASGPALQVASDKKAVFHLMGTSTLCDGNSGSQKGALQSAGKIAFQGNGTLNVSGRKKHGIQSSGSCTVNGGTINVLTAAKDGMNVDCFVMNGGTVSVTNPNGDGIDGDQGSIGIYGGTVTVNCTADDVKGICCDSTLTLAGGTVTVTVTGNQSKAIKTKGNLVVSGGIINVNANGTLVLEAAGSGYDPSYCTGMKAGGNILFVSGQTTITCPSVNAGGKAVSADNDIIVSGGTLDLTATGACDKYTDSTGTYDKYSSACLTADGNITVSGGTITATAGGRAINCDGNYTQSGGSVTTSTSAMGFTTIGTGTSCTDGFAAACLNTDGDITFIAGYFHGSSTGKGGRGLVADGTLTVGVAGAADSLVHIYVTTSGAPVNAVNSGGPGPGGSQTDYWKGLPKAVKIDGNITINSGHLQSYCSQTSGSTTGEAIESKDSLIINGGDIEANAYDDAINAGSYIEINGGRVWAYSRGNDGIDCNGTRVEINGGLVIARGSEVAVDDNGDHSGRLYISGGTVILYGGNMGTTEATPTVTNQKSVRISSSSVATSGFCIKNETTDTQILTYKWSNVSGSGFENGTKPPPGGQSGIYISTPDLQTGNTYKYYTSPNISGGTNWHGYYSGATVTLSGNGNSLTLQ